MQVVLGVVPAEEGEQPVAGGQLPLVPRARDALRSREAEGAAAARPGAGARARRGRDVGLGAEVRHLAEILVHALHGGLGGAMVGGVVLLQLGAVLLPPPAEKMQVRVCLLLCVPDPGPAAVHLLVVAGVLAGEGREDCGGSCTSHCVTTLDTTQQLRLQHHNTTRSSGMIVFKYLIMYDVSFLILYFLQHYLNLIYIRVLLE